jgi:DNA adenine methylase
LSRRRRSSIDETQHELMEIPTRVDPFLRWAGGKRRLVSSLLRALPSDVKQRTYHEAFVGAGSLFLAAQPRKGVLSDANPHLIACYQNIKDSPQLVARYLLAHRRNDCEDYYYEIRDCYNRAGFSAAQAARFIYLNKTCFNGIFRVNKAGEFNVPYGFKDAPVLPSEAELRLVSALLARTQLFARPFEESLNSLGQSDFVYLDPPYPPLNGTSFFTHYTSDRFGEADQRRLATAVSLISSNGAKFMMSNADTDLIREIYAGYRIQQIKVRRYITCKSIKHNVAELIITNYPVGNLSND